MENKVLPDHVAIIMDGNRRWAAARNKKARAGHQAGAANLEKLALYIFDQGIKYLSVYAFSTENFKRSKDEVDYLMKLLVVYLKNNFQKVKAKDVKVLISGRREGLNKEVIKAIDFIENKTKNGKNGIFNICINYGGRQEIVDASKKIALDYKADKLNLEELDENSFKTYLYLDLPPIDLVIRTSGETRLSNFLLYQLAYSEIYFTDTLFPDFNEEAFNQALKYFSNKNRRFGGN